MSHTGVGEQVCQRRTGAEGSHGSRPGRCPWGETLGYHRTSDEQEIDTAVSFIVRNIDKLTEGQRAELIAALSKL